jgi:NAD+ synthase (glutamine-hydrolysing)
MNFTVSTCTLNQWALDFDGNYERIRESILRAKSDGSHYRVGPELEISGYGCNDHFFEADTTNLSMEILEKLVLDSDLYGIICDVGM